MSTPPEVWVIVWEYLDKSGHGIVGDLAYEDFNAATHIAQTLSEQGTSKKFEAVKLGVVTGALQ
jgi:hypothetical protein